MDSRATAVIEEVMVDGKSSAWNYSWGKRALDMVVSGAGILIVSPIMAIVAVAVAVTSAGPVLFRQTRVGKDERTFQLLKFRTMTHSLNRTGPGITRKGDSRITPVGRFLRHCKLDELPQLINVLHGDMSLVGPRPDLPEFCQTLAKEYRELLTLKPGVTGWATLQFRNEEQLLAGVPATEFVAYYENTILPQKAQLDLAYAQRAALLSDLHILWQTVIALAH